MKKKLLTVFSCLVCILNLSAADVLLVDGVSIMKGGQGTIIVNSEFDTECTAFTFDMILPKELSLVVESASLLINSDHSLQCVQLSNGNYRFTCYSMSNAALPQIGSLLSVSVSANENATVGQSYNGIITAATFTTIARTEIVLPDTNFTLTIDDGRIKFDESATTLPTYTAGEKADVKMTRTIKADEWSTLVLPFTLSKAKAEAIFGDNVQLAEFSGFDTEYSDDDDITPDAIRIHFTTYTMTAKKGLTGGKPFLIKTAKDIDCFEADDVTLFDVVTDVSKVDEYDTGGKFTGTLVKSTVPADGLFISEDKFWYSTGATNIKAFRCWFELDAVLDKETDFGANVTFFIDDEATEISLTPNAPVAESGIYDLQGRKMNGNVQLPKGIYILNGKKVVK